VPPTQPAGSSLQVRVEYDSGPLAGTLRAAAPVQVVKEIKQKD
jgi:hypothetical protein